MTLKNIPDSLYDRLKQSAERNRRRDAAQHAAEDRVVDEIEPVQVEQSRQPARLEDGGLPDGAVRSVAGHLELQPRAAGKLRLGAQPQQPVALDRFHTPVHGPARTSRRTSASRQTGR